VGVDQGVGELVRTLAVLKILKRDRTYAYDLVVPVYWLRTSLLKIFRKAPHLHHFLSKHPVLQLHVRTRLHNLHLSMTQYFLCRIRGRIEPEYGFRK
jgi:hypothetical protein